MIARNKIEKTLIDLDNLYNKKGVTVKLQKYYAKLAILELAGWVEGSFDSIARGSVLSSLKTKACKEKVREIIKENSNLDYKKNFIKMMIKLVGIREVERVEQLKKIDAILPKLKSVLGELKKVRNKHAHTYIAGVTEQITATSRTLADFRSIVIALEKIDKEFKKK